MKLFQQIRRRSIAFSLALTILLAFVFNGMVPASWALSLSPSKSLAYSPMVMSVGNRAEAANQNFEGKVQETIGNITGDRQAQVKGQAKQATSQVRNAAEDVKDNAAASNNRLEAGVKTFTGKVQEAFGNITGDRQAQVEGRAKQAEGQVRGTVENVKDSVRNAFN